MSCDGSVLLWVLPFTMGVSKLSKGKDELVKMVQSGFLVLAGQLSTGD